jgi:hypothetical protein
MLRTARVKGHRQRLLLKSCRILISEHKTKELKKMVNKNTLKIF